MVKFVILLLTFALPSLCWAQGFCGLKSCNDRKHLDCTMYGVKWGPDCVDANMFDLRKAQRAMLNKVNSLRNKLAGGYLPNYLSATRMATVEWSTTLANLARRNVKKCNFTQDACVNTPDYNFVGETIARSVVWQYTTKTNLEILLDLFNTWWNENANATMSNMRRFQLPKEDSPVIANFAQMARDYNNRMGCAANTWPQGHMKVFQLTCLWNMANVVDWPIYDDGPVGKKCKTGINPYYPSLCSIYEKYNVNTFWNDSHYGS